MSYFHDATITHDGKTFLFSAAEGQALESSGNYWHREGEPSTWLGVAVFDAVRRKIGHAPEVVALELAAQSLGITADALRSLIRWNEEYMRWHDGDPDYKVLSE